MRNKTPTQVLVKICMGCIGGVDEAMGPAIFCFKSDAILKLKNSIVDNLSLYQSIKTNKNDYLLGNSLCCTPSKNDLFSLFFLVRW